jgi:predicted nucleic acid-binding protein
MAKYLLDTGILAGFVRGSDYAKFAQEKYDLFDSVNELFISVVSIGELRSLLIQFNWGEDKKMALKQIVNEIVCIDIHVEEILDRYAEIDTFSLGKNRTHPLPVGKSARIMQKNDLWIAATASVLNATLVTIDKDFDLFHNIYLDVVYIDKSQKIEN